MKLKFRADAQDILIFVIFAIFLLFVISLGVVNIARLSDGETLVINPFLGFSSEYFATTIAFYIVALVGLFASVSSYFFDREEGFGFSAGKKDKGYSRWAKDKEMKAVLKEVDPQAPTSEYAGIPSYISYWGNRCRENTKYYFTSNSMFS